MISPLLQLWWCKTADCALLLLASSTCYSPTFWLYWSWTIEWLKVEARQQHSLKRRLFLFLLSFFPGEKRTGTNSTTSSMLWKISNRISLPLSSSKRSAIDKQANTSSSASTFFVMEYLQFSHRCTHGPVPERNSDANNIKGQRHGGRCLVPQDPMNNGAPKQCLPRIDADCI